METHYFWAFFIIALIAGASIALTVNNATMTGNVWYNPATWGQQEEVYTPSSIVSKATTNCSNCQQVLNMLQNNCALYLAHMNNTCAMECSSLGKTCIMALTVSWQQNRTTPEFLYEQLDSCTRIRMGQSALMKRMDCMCCSP